MKVVMSVDERYSVLPQNIEKLFYSQKKDSPDWSIWAVGSAGVTLLGSYAQEETARKAYMSVINFLANDLTTGKHICPKDVEDNF